MNEDLNEKYKKLDLENYMFSLFIIASLLSISANEKARSNYKKESPLNENLRKEYIFISYLILFVFIVFLERNYNNLNNINEDNEEYEFAKVRLYGSILIVLGQLLIVYYLYNTTTFKNK